MSFYRRASSTPGLGFLGQTSSSADYLGDQTHRSLDDIDDEDDPVNTHAEDVPESFRDRISFGAKLLVRFLDFPSFEGLLNEYRDTIVNINLITPYLTFICSSLKTSIFEPLTQTSDGAGNDSLRYHLSYGLFRNTLGPVRYDGDTTLEQYTALFASGQNMRWEAVGLFFTAVGLAAITRAGQSATLASKGIDSRERIALARHMLEAGQACLGFCERIGRMIDAEIWLSSELSHLASVVEGDSSQVTWRQVGDAIGTCYAMGLHVEIRVSSQVPFWLSEMRKRTFAKIYNHDKATSTLLGRPPRLCRKYCSMQLPLDLDDVCLRLPPDQLEAVVNLLDADGWNRQHSIRGAARTRAALICDMIREDVLEFSLGTMPQNDAASANDVWHRSQEAWRSLPEWLRVPTSTTDDIEWSFRNHVRLDFMYNDFLLQRAMVRKLHNSSKELCRISRELLKLCLGIVLHMERVGKFTYDISWMVTQYGLPPAGVLALELLQHSQVKLRHGDDFPRSEVVQNLSRLIAYIKPLIPKDDANYFLCYQARKVIQKILDQVLSIPFEPSYNVSSVAWPSYTSAEHNTIDSHSAPWLPGGKSELDFWSNLPEHPLLAPVSD